MMYKIYGQRVCSFCDRAKELLTSRGIPFEYIDVSGNNEALDMFKAKGLRTVPQIWNEEGTHIGGFQELQQSI